jgi:segregation and condensation protein B
MKKSKKLPVTEAAPPVDSPTQPYVEVPRFEAVVDAPEETTEVNPAAAAAAVAESEAFANRSVAEAMSDEPTRVGDIDELAALAALSADADADAVKAPETEAAEERADQALEGSSEGTSEASPDQSAEGASGDSSEILSGAPSESSSELSSESSPQEEPAESPAVESSGRLESILESLLFASDKPLAIGDLKRLVNERDAKKLTTALERLQARHAESGIQLASAGGAWQFRTHPENAPWVAKLIAGRPARLSRAMLETLAIIAYRQPITRPEIDEIRGVDCGPVLKTLLDRALIRMIGKKEEVGRPILYGTTPEFLRTFSLKDLRELPTLREFHELGAAEMAKVDAEAPSTGAGGEAGVSAEGDVPATGGGAVRRAGAPNAMPAPTELPEPDAEEEEALLAELDGASEAAARASKPPEPPVAEPDSPAGAPARAPAAAPSHEASE